MDKYTENDTSKDKQWYLVRYDPTFNKDEHEKKDIK